MAPSHAQVVFPFCCLSTLKHPDLNFWIPEMWVELKNIIKKNYAKLNGFYNNKNIVMSKQNSQEIVKSDKAKQKHLKLKRRIVKIQKLTQ